MGDMNVITLFTTVLGIIGLAGGAVGYFGKSRGDSIIQYQANEIALRDGTIARLKEDLAAVTSENKVLNDQNKKLSDLAQGNPQLKTLTIAIEALTKIVTEKFKATT